MNSIQPTGAPSAFAGAASMPTGSTGRGTQGSGQYTEMPGDFALLDSVGLAEGQGIWERMAALIRRQRLDVRILLDAHDRKNQGKVDMDTFRRALCYAFGNVWIELAMTSAEFNQITKPYLTRTPNNPGEPEGFVAWQKFATDLQTLADKRTHSDTFMQQLTKVEARERVEADLMKNYGVTVYELKKTFRDLKNVLMLKAGSSSHLVTAAFRNMDRDHTGKIGSAEIKKYLDTAQRGNEKISAKVMDCIVDLCDNDGDGEVDYNELSHMILCDDIIELLALVPDKTKKCGQQMKDSQIIGWRNVTAKELQEAQKAIKERMMIKYKDIHTGLRKIDTKGDGILSRDEIKAMLQTLELLKHVNYHTGAVHGSITPACADTLIDYVDKNGDGKISYQEFHRVLTAENILVIPPPRNPAARFGSGKFA
jgi:Ca2+-binding EF-hand superfamily protein